MHDTADNAALIGRASLQAQRKGLSSPSPLRAGAVRIMLRLKELD